ncbi:glycosyltransferase [Cohnella cellulosilytica]|uniref:Glycosyltransferase n=1 Tax=Cohnella cellulosilytica TaxID=986710 RepID=A0ABW2FC38_9BACL
MSETSTIRIGCCAGRAKRINERAIDEQWTRYLGQYAEVVRIPPVALFKLFGGAIGDWRSRFPHSLDELGERLGELCRAYRISTLYMNVPALIPYLLMARSHAGLDLGFLFLAHSVGSEAWLRQWLAIAPWLSERDTLLTATATSREALLNVSDAYRTALHIPLCTAVDPSVPLETLLAGRTGKQLLSIGRIEDVKNIDLLLEGFAALRRTIPDLRLIVAGEYTGSLPGQTERYRARLEALVVRLRLDNSVSFVGPVDGEDKAALFRSSDILLNLSTDPGETFGFNLIEAKAYGLPVVCTSWDGFRELIADGEDGFLADCVWEADMPAPDLRQIVARCLELLRSGSRRRAMAERAFASARAYDYRSILPRIVGHAAERAKLPPPRMSGAAAIAAASPAELPDYYRRERLERLPFYRDSLLAILSEAAAIPPADWMPLAKPIIGHYAGRGAYAEL